jgi:phospholipase C
LAAYTRQVVQNTFREVVIDDNGSNPLPPLPGLRKSPIRHIVYVTKENRTYDEVLGQLPKAKAMRAWPGLVKKQWWLTA